MLTSKFCTECGEKFPQQREHQIYCSAECRKAANTRAVCGGNKLYPLVMRWRIERPRDCLRELTQLADQLAKEERIIRERRDRRIAEQVGDGK